MKNMTLFELPDPEMEASREAGPRPKPRVRKADRRQSRWLPISLDALLPADHQARAVWAYVAELDLHGFYEPIEAVEGCAGRPATDPRILLTLWIYATVDGVGSARAIERLCQEHSAYRWICGGVEVRRSTLSTFRKERTEALDELLTQSVGLLQHQGLVDLRRVAQDGMRVRASAGAASFRRERSLRRCLAEAEEQIDHLRREIDEGAGAADRRRKAARESAARSRAERVAEALKQLPELRARRAKSKRAEARVSTTDPDARVMKMADGGFRPAFNVQLAVDTDTQVVVGVEVTNKGSDYGELPPMVEQLQARHGTTPEEVLVDGGYVRRADLEALAACTVFAPVPRNGKSALPPHEPRPKDGPAVAEWRSRMGTDKAKQIYKQRGATVECVNAIARNRGLRQFLVRGLEAAKTVALLFAIAHNVVRTIALAA